MELETRQGFARFFLRGGFKNDDAHRVLILTVINQTSASTEITPYDNAEYNGTSLQ